MPEQRHSREDSPKLVTEQPFVDFFYSGARFQEQNVQFGAHRFDDADRSNPALKGNLYAQIYFALLELGFSHETFLIKPRVSAGDKRMQFLGMGSEADVYLREDLHRADKLPAALRTRTSVSTSGSEKPDIVNTHFDALINQVYKAVNIRVSAKLLGIKSLNPYVTPDGVYHEQLLPPDGKPIRTSEIFKEICNFHGTKFLKFGKEFFSVDSFNQSGHVLRYEGAQPNLVLIDGLSARQADISLAKSKKHVAVLERLNQQVVELKDTTLERMLTFLTPYDQWKKTRI